MQTLSQRHELTYPGFHSQWACKCFGSHSSALLLFSTMTTLARSAVTGAPLQDAPLLQKNSAKASTAHFPLSSCSGLREMINTSSPQIWAVLLPPRTHPYCGDIYILKYTSLFGARFHQLEWRNCLWLSWTVSRHLESWEGGGNEEIAQPPNLPRVL